MLVFRAMMPCTVRPGQCVWRVQILSSMELSLQQQLRHEYNKTARALNRTELNAQTMLSQHVTVVMDAIQLKVRHSIARVTCRVLVIEN